MRSAGPVGNDAIESKCVGLAWITSAGKTSCVNRTLAQPLSLEHAKQKAWANCYANTAGVNLVYCLLEIATWEEEISHRSMVLC